MTSPDHCDDDAAGVPDVTVVVVTYNAGKWLERCLDALLNQSFSRFDIVVIDNASTDDSLDRSASRLTHPRVRLERLDENIGFAAANNRAAASSDSGWIATLNPDAFAEPDWLATLMAATRRYPDTAMFGSTQLSATDGTRLDGAGDQYLFAGLPWRGGFGGPVLNLPPEGEVFAPCAAAALYRRADFMAVGGFDESFFCYVEDVDLGFRLRLAGARCIQVRDAVVRHVGGGTAGNAGGASDFARFHGTRNLIWTFVKCMPSPLFWPLLPGHVGCLIVLGIRALLRGQPVPVWRGIAAAIAGLPTVFAQRRQVQQTRAASTGDIARAMCWSVPSYLRRAAVSRAVDRPL